MHGPGRMSSSLPPQCRNFPTHVRDVLIRPPGSVNQVSTAFGPEGSGCDLESGWCATLRAYRRHDGLPIVNYDMHTDIRHGVIAARVHLHVWSTFDSMAAPTVTKDAGHVTGAFRSQAESAVV
jgi:hypothetical protein